MDALGWFILLLFIGVVCYAVYYANKMSTDDDVEVEEIESIPPHTTTPTYTPITKPKSSPVIKSTLKTAAESVQKKAEPIVVPIYEYTAKNHVKCCAYCDGENDFHRKTCCICGNELDI